MTQRTWLITGVNSGFGRFMTEALLQQGDRVASTVRKLDAMNDLKAKYGDRLWLKLVPYPMTSMPPSPFGHREPAAEAERRGPS